MIYVNKIKLVFQVIECSFGQLVERWRRLKFIYSRDLEFCCKLIVAACSLHNFCKRFGEVDVCVPSQDEDSDDSDDSAALVDQHTLAKRDVITKKI